MLGAAPKQTYEPGVSANTDDPIMDMVMEKESNAHPDGLVAQPSFSVQEGKRQEIIGNLLLHAMGLMGVSYRFGGNTPYEGLDCSGFMVYVFKKSMNIDLPRTAAAMAKVGSVVPRTQLRQGDLVFFNTRRGVINSHVGMYIGDGKFIHSPRTGKNIEISSLSAKYWSTRYNGARRVKRPKSFIYQTP